MSNVQPRPFSRPKISQWFQFTAVFPYMIFTRYGRDIEDQTVQIFIVRVTVIPWGRTRGGGGQKQTPLRPCSAVIVKQSGKTLLQANSRYIYREKLFQGNVCSLRFPLCLPDNYRTGWDSVGLLNLSYGSRRRRRTTKKDIIQPPYWILVGLNRPSCSSASTRNTNGQELHHYGFYCKSF